MPTRIGVIDVDRVVMDSAQGKAAFKHLQQLQKEKFTELKKMEDALAALEKKLSDQKFVLSDEKMADLNRQYQDKKIAYKRFKDDSERDLNTARKEALKKLERKIMPVIDQVGREGNFALVFNKFNSGLVFAADAVDITDQVLTRFDTQVNVPPPPAK